MTTIYGSVNEQVLEQTKESRLFLKKAEYDWFNIIFLFYRNLKKINKIYFNFVLKRQKLINFEKNIFLEPIFFYKPQYFAKRTLFYNFLKENNLTGLPFFKKNKNKFDKFYKNNLFLVFNSKNIINEKTIFSITDDSKELFLLKTVFDDSFNKNNLTNYLFFNLYIFNTVEIYKILLLLTIKLNKKYI